MSMPSIAAFSTLQFLWVWNDLLIARLFLGGGSNTTVIVALQQLLGTQGQGAELLTAGAFLSMLLPLIVFFSLPNFLVRDRKRVVEHTGVQARWRNSERQYS